MCFYSIRECPLFGAVYLKEEDNSTAPKAGPLNKFREKLKHLPNFSDTQKSPFQDSKRNFISSNMAGQEMFQNGGTSGKLISFVAYCPLIFGTFTDFSMLELGLV